MLSWGFGKSNSGGGILGADCRRVEPVSEIAEFYAFIFNDYRCPKIRSPSCSRDFRPFASAVEIRRWGVHETGGISRPGGGVTQAMAGGGVGVGVGTLGRQSALIL